jgi:uncharacterized protein with GYD domain
VPTFVMLSRFSPEAFRQPSGFKELAKRVSTELRSQCPEVEWKESYSLIGRFDVVDIFEAPDERAAEKVAMIVRAYGHAATETLMATPWNEFLNIL